MTSIQVVIGSGCLCPPRKRIDPLERVTYLCVPIGLRTPPIHHAVNTIFKGTQHELCILWMKYSQTLPICHRTVLVTFLQAGAAPTKCRLYVRWGATVNSDADTWKPIKKGRNPEARSIKFGFEQHDALEFRHQCPRFHRLLGKQGKRWETPTSDSTTARRKAPWLVQHTLKYLFEVLL